MGTLSPPPASFSFQQHSFDYGHSIGFTLSVWLGSRAHTSSVCASYLKGVVLCGAKRAPEHVTRAAEAQLLAEFWRYLGAG